MKTGLRQFRATNSVALRKPMKQPDGKRDPIVIGYFQTPFVAAGSSDSARARITESTSDGIIDWSDSTLEEIGPSDVAAELASLFARAGKVCWQNIAIFFESSIFACIRR